MTDGPSATLGPADAEDVVQETRLRWADVDAAEMRDPPAYWCGS